MSPAALSNHEEHFLSPLTKPASRDEVVSVAPAAIDWSPPPTRFIGKCHPLEKQITEEVNGYFLAHWPFKTDKDRKKFVAAGFSRVTCLYFPLSKPDRIYLACRLLTILFLIDDILEDMSLEEGAAYNEKLMPIARGDIQPDRSVPVEWMMFDMWELMRAQDRQLADDVLEPTFTFMRAQTDRARLSMRGLGPYLVYREKDVGKALLCSLMRFSMALHVTTEEISSVQHIEQTCAKHLSIVNDVFSWEKEVLAAHTGHPEGSALCSSVQILAEESSLTYDAAKRVLMVMCREWEVTFAKLVAQREQDKKVPPSANLMQYAKGLELQMSGNELWSRTTFRYIEPTSS